LCAGVHIAEPLLRPVYRIAPRKRSRRGFRIFDQN
jgi:hypothetical protein